MKCGHTGIRCQNESEMRSMIRKPEIVCPATIRLVSCLAPVSFQHLTQGDSPMAMFVGEALVGDGNEISHIDLLIGDKAGPVGTAFANALANQSAGHSSLLAVVSPNLVAKPATVMITKVT